MLSYLSITMSCLAHISFPPAFPFSSYLIAIAPLKCPKMANRLLASTLRHMQKMQTAGVSSRCKIGNREVVGFGFNGQPNYVDRVDFPMPAVRFKENTPDIQALHEKEKGDWRKLSLEEKKALYRASFCQTFAEMKAPTGEWKSVIGIALMAISLSIWIYMGMRLTVYRDLPESFSDECKEAQLKRMIDLAVNPIDGLASKWDYEKGDWK